MLKSVSIGAGALCAAALAAVAISLTGPSGPAHAAMQYCDSASITIERLDLAPSEVYEKCREAADFLGEVAIVNARVCEICPPSEVKIVGGPPPPPPPSFATPTPPYTLPAGTRVVDASTDLLACPKSHPPDWFLLTVPTTGSNCPSPYISGGGEWTNGKRVPNVRWCAACPAGYMQNRLDTHRCCIPDS